MEEKEFIYHKPSVIKIFKTFILHKFSLPLIFLFDLKGQAPISVHSLLNIKVNLESSILHDLQHFRTLNSNEIFKSKTFHLCASLQITNFQDGHKSIRIFSDILTFFWPNLSPILWHPGWEN